MKYATKRLIDSVWTLGYNETEEGIEIVSYDRENPIGYKQEKTLPQVNIIEDDERTIIGVQFRDYTYSFQDAGYGTELKVLNPQYIFAYTQ